MTCNKFAPVRDGLVVEEEGGRDVEVAHRDLGLVLDLVAIVVAGVLHDGGLDVQVELLLAQELRGAHCQLGI